MQLTQLDVPLVGTMVDKENAIADAEAVAKAANPGTKSKSRKVGKGKQVKQADGESQEQCQPEDMAARFLELHPTAKIVFIIDTHCLDETGSFIFIGNSPESYRACTMAEVSTTCVWTAVASVLHIGRLSAAASHKGCASSYPTLRKPLSTTTSA